MTKDYPTPVPAPRERSDSNPVKSPVILPKSSSGGNSNGVIPKPTIPGNRRAPPVRTVVNPNPNPANPTKPRIEQCGGCKEPIRRTPTTVVIQALRRSWHPECLLCIHCKLPFDISFKTFTNHNQRPVHTNCISNLAASPKQILNKSNTT